MGSEFTRRRLTPRARPASRRCRWIRCLPPVHCRRTVRRLPVRFPRSRRRSPAGLRPPRRASPRVR
ncbi:hypothetical protein BRD19_08600 [Halobacteriales archaeon SW_7_65_23]|nr:MAG: hypothetical protein BRD19_08600 [Halobacteriales archaeon SW_7_65_23]